ncbi:MAG: peptide deformylase [Candidatus Omnitrophota bacterium]
MSKTKLRIHHWGDKILRVKARPVKEVNDETREILGEMYLLMKLSDGLGLAANQAGIDLQLVVIETKEGVFKLVNPRIIRKRGSVVYEEGCLSFPGISLEVKRAKKIWVESLDEKGDPFSLEAEGVLAVALQHEIDHINGVVFIDRVSFFKRVFLSKKLKDIAKKTKTAMRQDDLKHKNKT